MEQLLREMTERFAQLPEEAQDMIRAFKEEDIAPYIAYVLGPEISALIDEMSPPTRQEDDLRFATMRNK